MRAAARAEAPPQSVATYIEDMLSELASMAESIGERNLAATLRLTAIQAARGTSRTED